MRKITSYREETEDLILGLTLLLMGLVLLVAAVLSVCLVPFLAIGMVYMTYLRTKRMHASLVRRAKPVTPQSSPQLYRIVQDCQTRLQPGRLDVFVVPAKVMNAYAFGLDEPRAVMIFESLLPVMDETELKFILGHEMGHVALGHTWWNTILSGLAGVPAGMGAAVIFTFIFRWWNRACEFSCDRAGLLACKDPHKAISAMIKLVARDADTPQEMARVVQALDRQDDHWLNELAEGLSTHPMLIKRIKAIQQYANTTSYRQVSSLMDQNEAQIRPV